MDPLVTLLAVLHLNNRFAISTKYFVTNSCLNKRTPISCSNGTEVYKQELGKCSCSYFKQNIGKGAQELWRASQ